jgi:hypothetical protein
MATHHRVSWLELCFLRAQSSRSAIASSAQLQRLVKIILRANVSVPVSEAAGLNATSLLLNALSSAQFWELPNLRSASTVNRCPSLIVFQLLF